MYEIDKNTLTIRSAKQFRNQVFALSPKPIVFWDTCALLNIARFIYREDPGDITTYEAIKKLHDSILANTILSVTCETVINEFNANIDKTVQETTDSVARTYNYYKNVADVCNALDGSTISIPDLRANGLPVKLYDLVKDIICHTIFVPVDITTTKNAYERVVQGIPPAKKKQEFKDCNIWEVCQETFRQVNTVNDNLLKIFYTVNTEDFCVIQNKQPQGFYQNLVMEATGNRALCCKTIFETVNALGL